MVGFNAEVVKVVLAVLDTHTFEELRDIFVRDGVTQNAISQLLGAVGIFGVEDDVSVPVGYDAAPLAIAGHQFRNLRTNEYVLRFTLDVNLIRRAVMIATHGVFFETNRSLARLNRVVHKVEQDLVLQIRTVDSDARQIFQPNRRRGFLSLVSGGNHVVRGVHNQGLHHTETANAVLQSL